MQALHLCQLHFPEKIPVIPTVELGAGSDGQVFEIKDSNNKVIKFCIAFDFIDNSIKSQYDNVNKILSYLKNNNIDFCAKVFEHNIIGEQYRFTITGPQKYLLYYYIMEKLNKISEDEKKVFHTILCHEDRGIEKNYSVEEVKEILKNLQVGLDFDFKKIILFYNQVKNSTLKHLDIHVRNIMKGDNGDFKLIDFDRCEI